MNTIRRSQLTPADQVAYSQLISSLADQCPHTVCGKPGIEQLPQLKPQDIAVICRNLDVDVMDQLVEELNLNQLASDIEAQDFPKLGARVALLMERACRAAIAYDVMCELEQRELDEDREHDLARWHRFGAIRVGESQA